ncbi:MAG: ABC transporter substrate-binding protein [Desulfobacterales bacterium]|nr:ABC transporter substrate-binding protein [Desulfobacterales bacterium]
MPEGTDGDRWRKCCRFNFDGLVKSPIHPRRINSGASLALKGHAGYLGTRMLHGAMAYIRQVNAQGGIHGRQITVIAYDDG